MTLDSRKPIDHAFVSAMKDRDERARESIKVEETIKAVQDTVDELRNAIVEGPVLPQWKLRAAGALFKGASLLLAKRIPDLKSIEHTNPPQRELTREQLIERLANLHAGTIKQPERSAADRTGQPDGTAQVQH